MGLALANRISLGRAETRLGKEKLISEAYPQK